MFPIYQLLFLHQLTKEAVLLNQLHCIHQVLNQSIDSLELVPSIASHGLEAFHLRLDLHLDFVFGTLDILLLLLHIGFLLVLVLLGVADELADAVRDLFLCALRELF